MKTIVFSLFYLVITCAGFSAGATLAIAAESSYMESHFQAVREYSRQVRAAQDKGAPLTADQKLALREQLFSSVPQSYLRDRASVKRAMVDIVRTAPTKSKSSLVPRDSRAPAERLSNYDDEGETSIRSSANVGGGASDRKPSSSSAPIEVTPGSASTISFGPNSD